MVKPRGTALVVLLALVGPVLVATACGSQDTSRATVGSGMATSATSGHPQPPLVSVYAAKTNIAKGTPGEVATAGAQIEIVKIPKQLAPEPAITSPGQIAGKVALFDIPAHSVLVPGMFVDRPGSTGSP